MICWYLNRAFRLGLLGLAFSMAGGICYEASAEVLLVDRSELAAATDASTRFIGSGDRLIVFGDSLSDVGNDSKFGGSQRQSNGDLLVEYFADEHAVGSPQASDDGGWNFAVKGATTGQMLREQLPAYLNALGQDDIPASDVFAIWGGSNDFLNNGSSVAGVANIRTILESLIERGARRFVIVNLVSPTGAPLFDEPLYRNYESAAHNFVESFNDSIGTVLDSLSADGTIRIVQVDAFSVYNEIQENAEAYGFLNLTGRGDLDKENADDYLYWDNIHPTTKAHRILADRLSRALGDWHFQSLEVRNAHETIRSGQIGDDEKSEIEVVIDGRGVLRYWRRLSSEANGDYLKVYVDDTLRESESGELAWEEVSLDLPEGIHQVRWSYEKNETLVGGEDAAWLDDIRFERIFGVSLEPNDVARGSVIGSGDYSEGDEIVVEAVPNAGYEFSHWSGAIGGGVNLEKRLSVVVTGDLEFVAHFERELPVDEWLQIRLTYSSEGNRNGVELDGLRANYRYTLEFSSDLEQWEDVSVFDGAPDASRVLEDISQNEVGFYRVKALKLN